MLERGKKRFAKEGCMCMSLYTRSKVCGSCLQPGIDESRWKASMNSIMTISVPPFMFHGEQDCLYLKSRHSRG